MQQELEQQQQQLAQQTQQQIAQEGRQSAKRDFFDLLMGAQDLTGQKVTVEQSPGAQIDYFYDFGSIFGPQQRASMFPTPYGTIERGPTQPTTQSKLPFGRKRGGIIDANDELLRIIGES